MKPEHFIFVFGILSCCCVIYVECCTTVGFFGQGGCWYKCRCVNNQCDREGQCTASSACQSGWFGPSCQYSDVAYNSRNNLVVTDGHDSTCLASSTSDTVIITMNRSVTFTWLRAVVKQHASHLLNNMALTLNQGYAGVSCLNLKKEFVNAWTVDMYCEVTEECNTVTLRGAAVSSLCSVYVSGGRNVGLKQTAYHEVTGQDYALGTHFTYWGYYAVDGDNRHNVSLRTCTRSAPGRPLWVVLLARTRIVHRYMVYNQDTLSYRLQYFKLEGLLGSQVVFTYRDTDPVVRLIYAFSSSRPVTLNQVKITTTHSDAVTSLCEVEIYGDANCDKNHYGWECQFSCHCEGTEACLITTGLCVSTRCAAGYLGTKCDTACGFGKYGLKCLKNCSSNCQPPRNSTTTPCHFASGACSAGCKPGYDGALCDTECSIGKFGINCSSECSQNCEPPADATKSTCNHVTGDCVEGCKPGYSTANCTTKCTNGWFGKDCISSCSKTCQVNTICDFVTGDCVQGCKAGYVGKKCENACEVGYYGDKCNYSCSPTCQALADPGNATCEYEGGACVHGCVSGFVGQYCESECSVGYFGKDCSSSCSKQCQEHGDTHNSTCEHETGLCVHGCKSGFSGKYCESAVSPTGSELYLILGMCLLCCAAFFIGFCLTRRRRKSTAEETDDIGQPGLTSEEE